MRIDDQNPFTVTKAVDFSNEEIRDTWVDLTGQRSLMALANLRSPVPMLVLGGKGSGRTHLLRYCSYPVQLLRHQDDLRTGFEKDGYLGVFVQCEGLNAGRFSGSSLSEEGWLAAFEQYMDLWLAQLALFTLLDAVGRLGYELDEVAFVSEVASFVSLDGEATPPAVSARGVLARLKDFQAELDVAVNNAPLLRSPPELTIRSSRGRLVFDLPRAFWNACPKIEKFTLIYLLDEVENLSEAQQRYVNTLVREKRHPVTLKIGCRTHGLRTLETLSAGERNRDGSEFERVDLDDHFRRRSSGYGTFARRMTAKRLSASNVLNISLNEIERLKESELRLLVDSGFNAPDPANYDHETTSFILDRFAPQDRPYLATLRNKLQAASSELVRGHRLKSEAEIPKIIKALQSERHPLVERANVFMFYQAWHDRKDTLLRRAALISESCAAFLDDNAALTPHKHVMGHFRADLLAQLLRETKQPVRYLGFDSHVQMSGGFPRHLLVILKSIYRWALFHEEQPFKGAPITARSQQQGVMQASNWFFEDARVVGHDPAALQGAVDRLAGLFRALRFSDKPVEPSLIAFACDEQRLSRPAQSVLHAAEQASLLLRIQGGHKNRNTRTVDACFQLNPMLSPRYQLAVGRRGVLELDAEDANSIFELPLANQFARFLRSRLQRMTAPFSKTSDSEFQPDLFG